MIYTPSSPRGFTLLIAVILSTVVLTVGLSLLDVAYKQTILSSTAKQSQAAFYNADSALECALYYDQKLDAFDFATPLAASSLTCSSTPVTNYSTVVNPAMTMRTTIFTTPCPGSGISATTTIYKYAGGATSLYADGFNTCTATDPRRVERGLKATYGDPSAPVIPSGPSLTYLIVAGGGGGAAWAGGGGGGGGVITGSAAATSGSYSIVVGSGGASGFTGSPTPSDYQGKNGTNSSFNGMSAIGGGGGGASTPVAAPGSAGGSGGGAGYPSSGTNAGGAGTAGQGNSGASEASVPGTWAGGGGGASAAGTSGSAAAAGAGGAGLSSAISGSSVVYGSGGGGGDWTATAFGPGGSGAGSGGGIGNPALANRGGGGGGGGFFPGPGGEPGGVGGSGVVIISIPTSSAAGITTTGATLTTSGGNNIYTFTGNGTFVVP
ncbi:MAG: hypothetical protein JWM39_275 [Parcubacteria group bacterium]|nr:hypothetical protein [Parcubacteria group bacterium]